MASLGNALDTRHSVVKTHSGFLFPCFNQRRVFFFKIRFISCCEIIQRTKLLIQEYFWGGGEGNLLSLNASN